MIEVPNTAPHANSPLVPVEGNSLALNDHRIFFNPAATPAFSDIPLKLSPENLIFLDALASAHAQHQILIAPDMRDYAEEYSRSLISLVMKNLNLADYGQLLGENLSHETLTEVIRVQGVKFYQEFSRDFLAPLVVNFVNQVLQSAPVGSTVAFLARDAEMYYQVGLLLETQPEIAERKLDLRYVTFNRTHLSIHDEMASEAIARSVEQEKLFRGYLRQENFHNTNGLVIIDTGCWGSMINGIQAEIAQGKENINLQGVHFIFSQNPYISGFMNAVNVKHSLSLERQDLEALNDTFECLPRAVSRSEKYVKEADSNLILPVYHEVRSPFLASWGRALNLGAQEAAQEFLSNPDGFENAGLSLARMVLKHEQAKSVFNGVFPKNTPTWSKGRGFIENWPWGKIPPLTD